MIRPIQRPLDTAPVAPVARRKRERRSISKVDVRRAVDAMRQCGIDVVSIEFAPDGTIRLTSAQATAATPPRDEFEKWQDRL